MKSNSENELDQPLHGLLRSWTVPTPLPPHFQEQVWHRIARAEAEVPKAITLWGSFSRWLEIALPRPKVALAYLATLLVLGVTAGSITAQVKSSHLNASLSSRYLYVVSPYQVEEPRP